MDAFVFFSFFGLFATLCILSAYKSITFKKDTHSFQRGFSLFLILGIIAFGISFLLFGGYVVVFGWLLGGGERGLLQYYILFSISIFVYWYGILKFHDRKTSLCLSISGFVLSIITGVTLFGSKMYHAFLEDPSYVLGMILIPTIILCIVMFYCIMGVGDSGKEIK